MSKWCTWCEKSNHDDSECWSTRSIPNWRDVEIGRNGLPLKPPVPFNEFMQRLREARVVSDRADFPDPEPLF